MTVYPVLWTYKPRQDGTCNVKIYEYSKAGKKYHQTEYYVHPNDWDKKKRRVRRSHPLAGAINQRLVGQVRHVEMELISGGRRDDGSLVELVRGYIEEVARGLHNIKASTNKQYKTHLSRLEGYCSHRNLKDLPFSQIDQAFYQDFTNYLSQTGCQLPGIAKHIKLLKKFMNEGLERGLHSNTAHQQKSFKVHRGNLTKSIYLNDSEMQAFQALDLATRPGLRREQERFLVAYYLILRHSDSIQIRPDRFFEQDGTRYYRNVAKKTEQGNYIPVKPVVWEILQARGFDLSGDTNQESNRKLKTISAMADIDQPVQGAKGEEVPKWSLVTTHTARRSAATNLYLSGMEVKVIAQLGGWKNEQVLRKYLLASGLDVAKLAKDNPFFS